MAGAACAAMPPASPPAPLASPPPWLPEWQRMHESKAPAFDVFNECKFGLFIHWGLYAIPGGVWKGQRMEDEGVDPTVAEWIMRRKSIPRAEYAELATRFNPVRFDADEWAGLAADAGMRYLVITSKHHDGFALFDSPVSDFDIVDATPFKRVVLRELDTTCARRGIRFGVYYSHGFDWRDGGDLGRARATWETCRTMNNSWGYKSYDHDWKSPLEVLSWLVDVVSRGDNYLLNVGPTSEGVIPPESARILREVGRWLRVNGEAIYGTRAWTTFREGPTVLSRRGTGHREKQGFTARFTPEDFWFTKKVDAVFAVALATPSNRTALMYRHCPPGHEPSADTSD